MELPFNDTENGDYPQFTEPKNTNGIIFSFSDDPFNFRFGSFDGMMVRENINVNGSFPNTLKAPQIAKIAKCFRSFHLSRIRFWLYVDNFIGETQVENKSQTI